MNFNHLGRFLFLILIIAGVASMNSCTLKEKELGSEGNPVKIYFTPSVDSETIASNSDQFIKYLEKETGLFFKTGIPTSYIAVVEAFGSKRADVAVMNSFGYILANQKYGAQAKLTVIRYGEKYYRGQIIAHVDSGINTVKDLENKKFAFTDASSTSGYMFPSKIIKESGVRLGNTVFAMKHDNVVTMVYQKQVDAGATYYSPPSAAGEIRDARARVKTQFPDVAEKVKIIKITEKIMNDPFVFRKGLDPKITNDIIAAIEKFIATEDGKKILKNIYSVDGLVRSSDKDYDGLRKMIAITNIDPNALLKKK